MRYLLLVLLIILCLIYNYNSINQYSKKNKINIVVDNKDVPPALSLTSIALGPLRSVLTNFLWLRSTSQTRKGEVYDSLQIIDWITTLQPHSPRIWEYQGWNIAYNIAYTSRDPYYRWDWVYYAFTLLRDKGLKYNPNHHFNRPIRQKMALILFDRINKDDFGFHNLFKYKWAEAMLSYFDSDRKEEIEAYATAHPTKELLLKDELFAKYYQLCKEELNKDILDFTKNPVTITPYQNSMKDKKRLEAHTKLYCFYKRKRIEKELKFDIEKMYYLNQLYGPFDWRLPQAHIIYWGYEKNHDDYFKTLLNFDITMRQTLLSAMREGTLKHLNKDKKTMIRGANLRMIRVLEHFFCPYLDNKNNKIVEKSSEVLHKSFVEEATTLLYIYNHAKTAKKLFVHYKESHPEEKIKFEEFILNSVKNTLRAEDDRGVESLINATLFEAYEFASLAEVNRANGYLKYAKLIYDQYQKKYKKLKQTARFLPPFNVLKKNAITQFKKQQGLSKKDNRFNNFIKNIQNIKPLDKIEIE